ncbi:hypothetical protein HY346_02835 [Candidatus Microgenomates bacterium]|nr:hypothetical protein [Candidatus Microgenomates bacterium]
MVDPSTGLAYLLGQHRVRVSDLLPADRLVLVRYMLDIPDEVRLALFKPRDELEQWLVRSAALGGRTTQSGDVRLPSGVTARTRVIYLAKVMRRLPRERTLLYTREGQVLHWKELTRTLTVVDDDALEKLLDDEPNLCAAIAIRVRYLIDDVIRDREHSLAALKHIRDAVVQVDNHLRSVATQ